jgi:hypothetical protein
MGNESWIHSLAVPTSAAESLRVTFRLPPRFRSSALVRLRCGSGCHRSRWVTEHAGEVAPDLVAKKIMHAAAHSPLNSSGMALESGARVVLKHVAKNSPTVAGDQTVAFGWRRASPTAARLTVWSRSQHIEPFSCAQQSGD